MNPNETELWLSIPDTDFRFEVSTAQNGSLWELKWHNGADFKQHLPQEAAFTIPDSTGEVAEDFLSTPLRHRPRLLKTSVTSLIRGGLPEENEEETIESKRRELRIENLPQELPDFMLDKPIRAADRGTATHKALCALDMEQPIAPQLDALMQRGTLTQEERALIRERDIAGFYAASLGQRVRAAQIVHREWGFCYMVGDMLVQGVIDLCFQEDGRWVLVDYKTDRCPAEELPALYGEQLRWYAKALRGITGLPVAELWLYSLREGRAVAVEE